MSMKAIIYSYFIYLIKPFKVQKYLSKRRIDGLIPWKGKGALLSLTLLEVISVSWVFAIVQSFYVLAEKNAEQDSFNLSANLPNIFGMGSSYKFSNALVMTMVIKVIFFPIGLWLYSKFLFYIIKFFTNIFGTDLEEAERDKAIHQVVNFSFTSFAFLSIPFVGKKIQSLTQIIYLYAGLKENIKMSGFQSLVTIFSPILLLAAFILFLFFSGALIVSSFFIW